MDDKLKSMIAFMSEVGEDNSVPRNIRRTVNEAKDKLKDENEELLVKITSAIYLLDEISNDVNMPMHTRTQIWSMVSGLESMKN
ncbi:MAG: UPF0147 family protein [Candidatus Diapherotrites archaeon]|nr:UPF0147 family protein [Candidatus Diapherotrites archaeon]